MWPMYLFIHILPVFSQHEYRFPKMFIWNSDIKLSYHFLFVWSTQYSTELKMQLSYLLREYKLIFSIQQWLLCDTVGISVCLLPKFSHASWSLIVSVPTNLCLAELPLNLNLSVKRFTVDSQSVAAFICTVSKVDLRVSWYRGDKKLYPSCKYEIVDEACTHKLIVHELSVDDYDDYIVVIGSRRMTGCMLREGECVSALLFVCLCVLVVVVFCFFLT